MDALGAIGEAAAPALTLALGNAQPDVYWAAYDALVAMRRPAVSALTDHVQDADRSQQSRRLGIWALADMGADAVDAAPTLISMLHDSEALYVDAFEALLSMGDAVGPYLIEAMIHTDPTIAWTTALSLRGLGESSVLHGGQQVTSRLLRVLEHGDPEVRQVAVWALGVIADEPIIAVLIGMLDDEALIVREEAQLALIKIGAIAVPHLAEAFRNPDFTSEIRARSVEVLMLIGEPAIEALTHALATDADPWVRWRAAWALSALVPTVSPDSNHLTSLINVTQNETDVRVKAWSERAQYRLSTDLRGNPFPGWEGSAFVHQVLANRIGEEDVSSFSDEIASAEEQELFVLGVAALMSRHLDLAGWLFWHDAHLRPHDAMTFSHLGLVLHEMYVDGGEAEAALLEGSISSLRQAAELAPQEASILNNMAYALSRRGLPDDLIEASWLIERAIQLDPEEALYWVRRALIAQALQEDEKALESIFVAHATNPVVTVATQPSRIDGFVEADKSYCAIVCLACDSCPPGIIGQLNRVTCLIEEQGAQMACQAGELFPTSFDCFGGFPEYGMLIPGIHAGFSFLTPFGELHVSIDGDGVVHWKAGVKVPAVRLEAGFGAVGSWDPDEGVMVTQLGPHVKVTGLGRGDLIKSHVIDKFEAWGPSANPFVVKFSSEVTEETGQLNDSVTIESSGFKVWTSH